MRKLFILAVLAPLLFISCARQAKTPITSAPGPATANSAEDFYGKKIKIGNTDLRVQIVTTDADMRQGLSGRSFMPEDAGMLFDFKKPQAGGFWMKDMKFNLDFIWIASSTVVGITPRVPAPAKDKGLKIKDSDLPLYYSPAAVDMVLEINEGWAEKNGINVGDRVTLN